MFRFIGICCFTLWWHICFDLLLHYLSRIFHVVHHFPMYFFFTRSFFFFQNFHHVFIFHAFIFSVCLVHVISSFFELIFGLVRFHHVFNFFTRSFFMFNVVDRVFIHFCFLFVQWLLTKELSRLKTLAELTEPERR